MNYSIIFLLLFSCIAYSVQSVPLLQVLQSRQMSGKQLNAREQFRVACLEEYRAVCDKTKEEKDALLYDIVGNTNVYEWLVKRYKIGALLFAGANPNMHPYGTSVLNAAIMSNDYDVSWLLLRLGADPSARDSYCTAPLECARSVDIAQLLYSYGASLYVITMSDSISKGRSAELIDWYLSTGIIKPLTDDHWQDQINAFLYQINNYYLEEIPKMISLFANRAKSCNWDRTIANLKAGIDDPHSSQKITRYNRCLEAIAEITAEEVSASMKNKTF